MIAHGKWYALLSKTEGQEYRRKNGYGSVDGVYLKEHLGIYIKSNIKYDNTRPFSYAQRYTQELVAYSILYDPATGHWDYHTHRTTTNKSNITTTKERINTNKKANMLYWKGLDNLTATFVNDFIEQAVAEVHIDEDVATVMAKELEIFLLKQLSAKGVDVAKCYPYVNED